ncbi:MAG TPA: Nramp family divalent metal transporter [Candidatus Bathyarchaeia archaeon]|nr:Nramp family divalent metal transporter [Candidatus Bathyarchaeia archaeon]
MEVAEIGSRLRIAANRVLKPPEEMTKQTFRRLNLRSLFLYLGPSLIVSMAYMDPGNYGTDLQSGQFFSYDLLWAVWLANLMAMVLQYLSGKLGIATGKGLPELVRSSLGTKRLTLPYWLGAEVAAAATDLAEYLGTVIALNILFQIPLLYAAIFGAGDVIILLVLARERFRIIEYFFMVLVSIIGIGFLYELLVIHPVLASIAYHSVIASVSSNTILYVVGIVGATVMPHALFVHSTLTKDKLATLTKGTLDDKRQHRRLHLREVVLTLTIASLVNVAILVSAASVLYPQYSKLTGVDVNQYVLILKPVYGYLAGTVFAITLLASGLASSTTGTLAGQAIMDGLLGTRVNRTLRRVVTRVVNVFPTTFAILLGLNPFSLLVYSQVVLSLMIPLPMIPLIIYTTNKKLMGEFANRKITDVLAIGAAVLILALNAYLIITII